MHANDGERRSADTVTVAADTWRPLNAIAQTLANPFGIVIGAEDPDLVLRVTWPTRLKGATGVAHCTSEYSRLQPDGVAVAFEFRAHKDDTAKDVEGLF
jgi:hypothetical protein